MAQTHTALGPRRVHDHSAASSCSPVWRAVCLLCYRLTRLLLNIVGGRWRRCPSQELHTNVRYSSAKVKHGAAACRSEGDPGGVHSHPKGIPLGEVQLCGKPGSSRWGVRLPAYFLTRAAIDLSALATASQNDRYLPYSSLGRRVVVTSSRRTYRSSSVPE